MFKRKKLYMVMLLAFIISLTACGAQTSTPSEYDNYAPASEEAGYSVNESYDGDANNVEYKTDSTTESGIQSAYEYPEHEKLIITRDLYVETEKFDESVKKIEALTKEAKGYVESVSAEYGTMYDKTVNRSVSYVIRIPKDTKIDVVSRIKSDVGQVVNENMMTENVTKRISDARRDANIAKAKEDRLLELTKKTNDIESLIAIEKELATAIAEREYKEAEIKNLEHSVKYDYLNLQLREVRKYTEVQSEDSFLGDLKTAFNDSLVSIISGVQSFILLVVRYWYLLPLLAIVVFLLKVVPNKMRNLGFLKNRGTRNEKKHKRENSNFKSEYTKKQNSDEIDGDNKGGSN